MSQDELFLLKPGFMDPQQPGAVFVCPDSIAIEGQLACLPERARRLSVQRFDFPKPRAAVVRLLGSANQSLPLLIFGDDTPPPSDAQHHGAIAFTNDPKRIMEMLAERHGFPRLHH